MEFVNWATLATNSGALTMVLIITQLTKDIPIIKKIPTQLFSYFVALIILYVSYYFTGQLNFSNSFLILFNGIIIALSANGGFTALNNAFPKLFKKSDNDQISE